MNSESQVMTDYLFIIMKLRHHSYCSHEYENLSQLLIIYMTPDEQSPDKNSREV